MENLSKVCLFNRSINFITPLKISKSDFTKSSELFFFSIVLVETISNSTITATTTTTTTATTKTTTITATIKTTTTTTTATTT